MFAIIVTVLVAVGWLVVRCNVTASMMRHQMFRKDAR